MSLQHTNRRGDVYHLQAKKRKGGAIGYSFTRKLTGDPVERLPEGFEIYENPDNAQVFIRKIKPSEILPAEKKLLEDSIRSLGNVEHFIVAVDGDSLVVYTADVDTDAAIGLMSIMGPMSAAVIREHEEWMVSRARYTKVLRFTLIDPASRQFYAERWCFRGSVDDWITLGGGKPLAKLAKEYLPHLEKESFFDLM